MSNETKWTPGPWVFKPKGNYAHGPMDLNGRPIVAWSGMARPRQVDGMANGYLIAAAPDLYEALDAVTQYLELDGRESGLCRLAKRALAKARGES